MIPETLELVKIHKNPNFIDECIRILNEEWPRDSSSRMKTLKKSSENFPMCLALVDSKQKKVLGFVKLSSEKPFSPIVFVESLIVEKNHRGKGFGRFIMEQVEDIARKRDFKKIHLTTIDQEHFYCKIGYSHVSPKANGNDGNKILMYKNL